MTPIDIVERIMTAHWDLAACCCWVCRAGRAAGYSPRERWLDHRNGNRERFPVPADWVQQPGDGREGE